MRELHINDDPGCDLESRGIVVLVTNYTCEPYEGSGEAMALYQDGRVGVFNLGHCSCYGPFEYGECESFTDLEEFKTKVSCVGDLLNDIFIRECEKEQQNA